MTTQSVQVKLELCHHAFVRQKPLPNGYTHDWVVFVRGPEGTNIQHFVDRVIFHLHESFSKPRRVKKEPPYEVRESGYAGFLMPIDIYFKNKEEPKKVRFEYDLFLNREDCPPVNHIRCEKLTFQNPTEEFRRRLIKAGGVGLPGPGEYSGTVSESTGSAPEAGKKPVNPPQETKGPVHVTENSEFVELFGPPIKAETPKKKDKSHSSSKEKSRSKSSNHPSSSSSSSKSHKDGGSSGSREKSSISPKDKSPKDKSPKDKSITPPKDKTSASPKEKSVTPPKDKSSPPKSEKLHSPAKEKEKEKSSSKRPPEDAPNDSSERKKKKKEDKNKDRSEKSERHKEKSKSPKDKEHSSKSKSSSHKSSKRSENSESGSHSNHSSSKSSSKSKPTEPSSQKSSTNQQTLPSLEKIKTELQPFSELLSDGELSDEFDSLFDSVTKAADSEEPEKVPPPSFSSLFEDIKSSIDQDEDSMLTPLPDAWKGSPNPQDLFSSDGSEQIAHSDGEKSKKRHLEEKKKGKEKSKKDKSERREKKSKEHKKMKKSSSHKSEKTSHDKSSDSVTKHMHKVVDEESQDSLIATPTEKPVKPLDKPMATLPSNLTGSHADKPFAVVKPVVPFCDNADFNDTLDHMDTNDSKLDLPPPQLSPFSDTPVEPPLARNGVIMTDLQEIHRILQTSSNRDLLQKVVDTIEHTGLWDLTETTLNFDLCKLDSSTVDKIKDVIHAMS